MKENRVPYLTFALVFFVWLYFLFLVPTFDLDESLYRRVAEEMKLNGQLWHPTWDGQALFHKPPFFYWMIAAVSRIFDGALAPVSIFSSRLPSFLATIGILFSLFNFSKKINLSYAWLAPLLFCSALFPVLTATSVIFDPIQTLLLMPSLLIPTRLFLNSTSALSKRECILWSLSLFAATAFKGLNGLVIPSFAFGLHLLFSIQNTTKNTDQKKEGLKSALQNLKIFVVQVLFPAFLLTGGLFWYLDQKMGRAFSYEFFVVQHFGRSSNPMENHAGSFLYHPLSVFFGAGFLAPILLYAWFTRRPSFLKFGFPLTYSLAFISIFSFSATKLPHYTWPVWPALALAAAFALQQPNLSHRLSKVAGFLFSTPVFLICVFSLFLALSPFSILSFFHLDETAVTLLKYFKGFSLLSRLFFAVASALSFFFLVNRTPVVQRPVLATSLSLSVTACLLLGLMPTVLSLWVHPLHQIAQDLRNAGAKPGDCLRYNGPHSPTLSLALGPDLIHNRNCEPTEGRFLITPEWKLGECELFKMHVIAQEEYLYLCKRD